MKITLESALTLAGYGLTAIRAIVKNGHARVAFDVADAVRRVVLALDDAADGKVTPESARRSIDALLESLRKNDAEVDARLRERFEDEGGKP